MPVDPVLVPLLDMINNLPYMNPPFDAAAFRLGDEQPMPAFKADIAEVRDLTLDTVAGPVRARLYHPAPGTAQPLLFFMHGGGWVFGTIETHDPLCRALASAAEVAVLSLEYPLSPEHRYPVALDTMRAALAAAIDQAGTLGIDPLRIAIGGDSAGGNLSAAVALLAAQRGGPKINYQILIYPVTDSALDTPSCREFAAGPFLTRPAMQWFWDHYLPDATKRGEPTASPLRAPRELLAKLPPAFVLTAELDPLRDEGELYARRLIDAGVTVALAADCNPGTSYTTSIPFCIALAVREMGMTPDEAVEAATLGGAKALRRTDVGHLARGARADAVLLDAPTHIHLAYRPGVPLVAAVWQHGHLIFSPPRG